MVSSNSLNQLPLNSSNCLNCYTTIQQQQPHKILLIKKWNLKEHFSKDDIQIATSMQGHTALTVILTPTDGYYQNRN